MPPTPAPSSTPPRPAPRSPAAADRPPTAGITRELLLTAALAQLEEDGALTANLEVIRRRARVSVGAVYHHFPDRDSLAAALYVRLTRQFQEGFIAAVEGAGGYRRGICAGVRHHLEWVSANRAPASFLLSQRPAGDAELDALNRAFFKRAMRWWRAGVGARAVRDLPFDVIDALWLGPAHEYSRHWVAGRAKRVPATVADVLADAAWASLREAPR